MNWRSRWTRRWLDRSLDLAPPEIRKRYTYNMKKISRYEVIKYFLTIKNTYSIHSLSTHISLSIFLLFSSITTFLLVCFTDVVSLLCRLVQLFGEHLEHALDRGEGFLGLPQRCPEAVQHTVLGRLPGGPEPQHGLIVVHLSQNTDQSSSNVHHLHLYNVLLFC